MERNTKGSAFGVILFLVVFGGLIGTALFFSLSEGEVKEQGKLVFGYVMSIIFMGAGIMGIYKKIKMSQNIHNMISVLGVQTDFVVSYHLRSSTNASEVYQPIYEYEWGGERRQYKSSVAGSHKKYRTIGRQVHILVNPQTGEVFCSEDEKTAGGLFLFIGIFGAVTFVIMLMLTFK